MARPELIYGAAAAAQAFSKGEINVGKWEDETSKEEEITKKEEGGRRFWPYARIYKFPEGEVKRGS